MTLLFEVSIDTAGYSDDLQEILNLRYDLEDSIEQQNIGEVVDGGIMMDGSSIDIAFIAPDEEPAREAVEGLLNDKDLLEKSSFDIGPYEEDDFDEDFMEDEDE